MHKVSEQTVQITQKHALQSLEHGKLVEEVGKRLQNDSQIEPKVGQSIEASGKTIQENAQEFLEKSQELASDASTQVFVESVQAHINANQSHIAAVKEFQKGLQAPYNEVKKYCQS
ncbi:hypothetical protein NIES2101_22255 [Calothrix sp. HK-06]|nr:hypothetical protein NIES2101_22255 [Calothrix sp. HK-06]